MGQDLHTDDFEEQQKKLKNILRQLRMSVGAGIEASAIVGHEGLPIVSDLPQDMDELRFAAITAASLALGERAMMEVSKGELERISVEGSDGIIVSISCGAAVLTVTVDKATKTPLGLLFHEMSKAATKIKEIIPEEE
ncbi:MAG: roadblock/LC7 domain-containing protein [Candidatus Hodarchaeota archaeon]